MGEMREITDHAPNAGLVKILESMLIDAKSGKIRTMVAIVGWDDGTWTSNWAIDSRTNRMSMMGELVMLQYDMTTNIALRDAQTPISKAIDGE